MKEVYLIWTEGGYDSPKLHKICRSKEIAEKEKTKLLTQINFLKDCYNQRHNSNWDEDLKYLDDHSNNMTDDYELYLEWFYLFQAEFPEMKIQLIDIEKQEVINE